MFFAAKGSNGRALVMPAAFVSAVSTRIMKIEGKSGVAIETKVKVAFNLFPIPACELLKCVGCQYPS
jgi:hypothetical protein